jgi:hypothetical protein
VIYRPVNLSIKHSVSRDSEPQSENRGITLFQGMKTIYVVDEKDRVIPSANIPPMSAGAAVHVTLRIES